MDTIKYYWATILTKNNIGITPEYETKLFESLHPVEYVLEINKCYKADKMLKTYCTVITWGDLTEEQYNSFSNIQNPNLYSEL